MNTLDELKSKYKDGMDWPVKGCEPLNLEIAKRNLLRLANVFDVCKICYWLAFGTALGAYRDQAFIPYDYDVDVGIYNSDVPKLFNATAILQNYGFTLSRVTGQLISYARNKEYIDVYVFSRSGGMYKCGSYHARLEQFDNLNTIEFIGHDFSIPSNPELYFKERYGEDWKEPIRNRPAKY